MINQNKKCEEFARLHQQTDAFLIPNPWDVGSAKVLQALGFKALATTSSGLAYTLGKADGQVTLEEKLSHCSTLVANTSIPINADFENGFADSPEMVVNNLLRVANSGVAGCSIEDFSRESLSIYDFNHSVERVLAAVEAVASLNIPFQLTARAENLLHGIDDLEDTIKRLKAFEAAGAQVLYAPGINSLAQLKQVTSELDKPFNVLAPFIKNASVQQLASHGAHRISVGGALNWAAVNPLLTAAKEMLHQGTFDWTEKLVSSNEVNKLLD